MNSWNIIWLSTPLQQASGREAFFERSGIKLFPALRAEEHAVPAAQLAFISKKNAKKECNLSSAPEYCNLQLVTQIDTED